MVTYEQIRLHKYRPSSHTDCCHSPQVGLVREPFGRLAGRPLEFAGSSSFSDLASCDKEVDVAVHCSATVLYLLPQRELHNYHCHCFY
jgi:hypothetical protein